MSLAQIIELSCDVDGCEQTFTADGVGRIEARKQAAAAGWRRSVKRGSAPRDDLCPTHAGKATKTLPCGICGEPIEVPTTARQASHGGHCSRFIADRLVSLGNGVIPVGDLLAAGLLHD